MVSSNGPTDAVAFHSEIASKFHASYRRDANRLERVRVWKHLLDRYAPGAALAYDVGCGSGVLACEIARRGIETIGIDGAPGMLALAERTARQSGLSALSFQEHRLPISDTTNFRAADLVICSSVIEYLDSIPESLVFLRKLLKPNGLLILSVSNRDSWSRKLVRLVHRLISRPKYIGLVLHFVTVTEIESCLRDAGLTPIEHGYCGGADLLNKILSLFLPVRMASNMIVLVARRT